MFYIPIHSPTNVPLSRLSTRPIYVYTLLHSANDSDDEYHPYSMLPGASAGKKGGAGDGSRSTRPEVNIPILPAFC